MSVSIQQFRKTGLTGTTVTLQPSLKLAEGRPNSLRINQLVITYAATPSELWGATVGDSVEFEITIKRST
jgi:hypothetical protein